MPKFDAGMEAMLDTFVFETSELLENLDEILMRTEQSTLEPDDIAEIFRTMHTIKGSASMMGLQNMSKLAHSLEDLFSIIRDKPDIAFDKPALYELLFDGSDCLKNETENLSDDSIPLTDFTERIAKIHAFADNMKGGGNTQNDTAAVSEIDIFPDDEAEDIITLCVRYDEACAMPAVRSMVLMNSISGDTEVVRTIPADLMADEADGIINKNGLIIKLKCGDVAAAEAELKSGLDVVSVERLEKTAKAPAKKPEKKPAEAKPAGGERVIQIRFNKDCQMPSIRAMVLINSISDISEILEQKPEKLDNEVLARDGLTLRVKCSDTEKVLRILSEGVEVESVKDVTPENTAAAGAAGTANAPAQHGTQQSGSSIISVKLEKLDRLLDLVTEIVITESAFSALENTGSNGDTDTLAKSARELKKLTDELQDVVMSIRMVPVQAVFQKMNRIVRDMNKKLGKNVTLVLQGADTEADKSVVDLLGDPLMHIVRNAVDHGIESPEERAQKGKTEPAQVVLSAYYENSEVVISCEDNGAGMNPGALLDKAAQKGILTKPREEYTEQECFNLIMAAGFSTNTKITEFSGRGVGMDVVKKNIEKVGGKLSISSKFGQGSTFTIRIPLSLSIIDALAVQVSDCDISIPLANIKEIFKASESSLIKTPKGDRQILFREQCLPVISLSQAFGLEDSTSEADGIMLLCTDSGRDAVVFVDKMLSDRQIVVKPFSPLLSSFNLKEKGLQGCAILANGDITLIADIGEIFNSNHVQGG